MQTRGGATLREVVQNPVQLFVAPFTESANFLLKSVPFSPNPILFAGLSATIVLQASYLSNRGNVLLKLARWDAAEKDITASIAIQSDNAKVIFNLILIQKLFVVVFASLQIGIKFPTKSKTTFIAIKQCKGFCFLANWDQVGFNSIPIQLKNCSFCFTLNWNQVTNKKTAPLQCKGNIVTALSQHLFFLLHC